MNRIAKRAFPGLFSACALACAMGAAMLAGVPAQAQGPASEPGGYYRAELATPLAAPRHLHRAQDQGRGGRHDPRLGGT